MANEGDLSMIQENLDEYVNDENKVVTCKWLSLTLNLNINVAKRALYIFVQHQRRTKTNSAINVTYFVAGLGKSKSGDLEHKCVVVPESDLEAVKSSLSVVTSVHVYSVQNVQLKDYTALYQTDFDVIKQNLDKCSKFSSIQCDWVSQQARKQPVRVPEKTNSSHKTEKNESPATAPVSSSSTSGPATGSKTASKKVEPKGIAKMFESAKQKTGKQEEAPSIQIKEEKTVSKGHKSKSPEKKTGVLGFFTSNGVNKKGSPSIGPLQTSEVKTVQKQNGKKTKADESDDEAPLFKRRRKTTDDLFDSSEDENKDDEDESEGETKEEALDTQESPLQAEESRVKETEEPTNGQPDNHQHSPAQADMTNGGERKRKRVMKTVTRQYQDEEGFLVTKKESVWESESDNSEPEEPVVEEEKKPEVSGKQQKAAPNNKVETKKKPASKKTVSPQKGKQMSLTSFFKKK